MMNLHPSTTSNSSIHIWQVLLLLVVLGCAQHRDIINNEIGETPAIVHHITNEEISDSTLSIEELIALGQILFSTSFNSLDGATNSKLRLIPTTSDEYSITSRFNRISGPDANACSGCHNLPRVGGGGDNVANVFVLAHEFPNINFDHSSGDLFENLTLRSAGNERGTPSMFGSGIIELLAREMSNDLQFIKEAAIQKAKNTQQSVTVNAITKEVSFGKLTAWPDGLVDLSRIEGVDEDLIIKPFGQKGVFTSLREFTIKSLQLHHGIQATERVGVNIDADKDGITNELTSGDITALTLFQATLPPPIQVLPESKEMIELTSRGEKVFNTIGCTMCHKTFLELNSPLYFEPNPFNPSGTISDGSLSKEYTINLASIFDNNAIEKINNDSYKIYAFTDLKRHEMGPLLNNEKQEQDFVGTSIWLTRKLWGIMDEPPFLHHGRATLISEAIKAHGGEAEKSKNNYINLPKEKQDELIEFIKTFQNN